MKNIETIVPHTSVSPTIEQLRELDIRDVTVEPVKVYKKNLHQTMIYRGSTYEQDFISESKLRFAVSDVDAPRAEEIVASLARR